MGADSTNKLPIRANLKSLPNRFYPTTPSPGGSFIPLSDPSDDSSDNSSNAKATEWDLEICFDDIDRNEKDISFDSEACSSVKTEQSDSS